MTREREALKALLETLTKPPHEYSFVLPANVHDSIRSARAVLAEPESGWVRMSARLPDSRVTWCWTSDGLHSYPGIWDSYSKTFDCSGPWIHDAANMRPVTHWMPLPPAPKEGA